MNNETKTKIIVEFNSEKVSAMRIYLTGKGTSIENEMKKYLDILFDKNVPTQVRDFIAMKAENSEKKEKRSMKTASQSQVQAGGGVAELWGEV